MIRVGVTGGIGSGKTMVCKIFTALGVPVFNADEEARRLMETDKLLASSLRELLGDEAFDNGMPNRKIIASMIFGNPQLLARVNALVHPRVGELFHRWCQVHDRIPYAVHETALLFESGAQKLADRYVTVLAPDALRIHRTMQRSSMERIQVERIMRNQIPEARKAELSHHVIVNDDKTPLIPQVLLLDGVLRNEWEKQFSL